MVFKWGLKTQFLKETGFLGRDFALNNRNFAMLHWLNCLEPKFKPGALLKWSSDRFN